LSDQSVAQYDIQPTLRLTGEQRDTKVLRLPDIGRQLRQHRQATGYMETADTHLDAAGAQLPGDVEGTRELIGLHADDADMPRPLAAWMACAIRSARMWVLVSSSAIISSSTSVPNTARCLQSMASPQRAASVLDGMAERSH
jgi:hypothetical protein